MNESTAIHSEAKEIDPDRLHEEAAALVRSQKTMVLATSEGCAPWCAPVYYFYRRPGFYFFSSIRSRHIEQALTGRPAAAAIFHDSRKWQDIQGLQMTGKVAEVCGKLEKAKIIGLFLLKFPFAEAFLKPLQAAAAPADSDRRVSLFVFTPDSIYYTNNSFGFGRRFALEL